MHFDTTLDRVALIIEKDINRKPFGKDIAEALGIAAAQYSNNKKNQNIPALKIIEYCLKKEINTNWVFSGNGAMWLSQMNEDISRVKMIHGVQASAGGGAYNEDNEEDSYLSVDNIFMERLGILHNTNIEALTVTGDSMEPGLKDESIVLIDRNKTNITNGGIFVVNTDMGLLIKRVSPTLEGVLHLKSDNSLYDTLSVPTERAAIIGKVIGSLGKA